MKLENFVFNGSWLKNSLGILTLFKSITPSILFSFNLKYISPAIGKLNNVPSISFKKYEVLSYPNFIRSKLQANDQQYLKQFYQAAMTKNHFGKFSQYGFNDEIGVLTKSFHNFAKKKDNVRLRKNGVMVSTAQGKAVPYALWNLEDRGSIIIEPNSEVYSGMIIGEHNKSNDLEVNPLKNKQLTNIRASGKDEAIKLSPIKKFTLEKAISYINEDELVEVTPKTIRLRKKLLLQHERKKELRNISK